MTTAEAIKKLRKKLNFSQVEFGKQLGVTVTSVSRYENGREPNNDILRKLADIAAVADQTTLAHLFMAARSTDIVARAESLPTEGSAPRVSVDTLKWWFTLFQTVELRTGQISSLVDRVLATIPDSDEKSQIISELTFLFNEIYGFSYRGRADMQLYIAPGKSMDWSGSGHHQREYIAASQRFTTDAPSTHTRASKKRDPSSPQRD